MRIAPRNCTRNRIDDVQGVSLHCANEAETASTELSFRDCIFIGLRQNLLNEVSAVTENKIPKVPFDLTSFTNYSFKEQFKGCFNKNA